MSGKILPFPPRAAPREIESLRPVLTQVRQLDPAAWGFPDRAAMERAWAAEDDDGEAA